MTKKEKALKASRKQDEAKPKGKALSVAQRLLVEEQWKIIEDAYFTYRPLWVVWANDPQGVELPYGFWSEIEAKRFVEQHPDKDELLIDSYNHRSGPRIPLIREH